MDSPTTCGPPPLAAVYTDLPTAVTAIQDHAKANGYALFIRNSKPKRVIYACDRYGKPQSKPKNPAIHDSKRREGSRSKKCDCQMKLAIERDETTGKWEVVILEGIHNHEPSAAPAAHPAHRIAALGPDTHAQVERLALAGLNNAQILAVVRQESPSILLSQKDISNLVVKCTVGVLGRRVEIAGSGVEIAQPF